MSTEGETLVRAAERLRGELDALTFGSPVTHVYNTLRYAWEPYVRYLKRYASREKRVLILGMNPGPWGMAQTGVPFGEIEAVRDWMGIEAPVGQPAELHPKRPIHGFQCRRSEVSGKRLWGLMQERFGPAPNFFEEHFVLNYCPLLFFEESGTNRTPDKLKKAERTSLFAACDAFLAEAVHRFRPRFLVGIGRFAADRLRSLAEGAVLGRPTEQPGGTAEPPENPPPALHVVQLPHPSPANPAANRDWAGAATSVLVREGVWSE